MYPPRNKDHLLARGHGMGLAQVLILSRFRMGLNETLQILAVPAGRHRS